VNDLNSSIVAERTQKVLITIQTLNHTEKGG